jgi:RNA polymerase sigma-70 factor (ECF subfamily)
MVDGMPPRRRGARRTPAEGSVPAPRSPAEQSDDARQELDALRRGDQAVFAALVRRLHPSMVRLATSYVSSRAVAEEVAQDTWVAVLEELDRFEGRSSLKTWIFRILVNRAKTRGVRDRRTLPFSSLGPPQEATETGLPPDAFFDDDHRWAGHWAAPVPAWDMPEEHLLSSELGGVIRDAVDGLPPTQRAVVSLRDGQSLSAHEVCDLLGLSEANQRVLLHRGRSAVRAAIATYADRMGVAV